MGKNKTLKNCGIFEELIKNDDFIDEILNTEDGVALIEKFDSYGVDLSQIDFSELCRILSQKIQLDSKTYEVDSLIDSITPDYTSSTEKTVVSFEEKV